MTVSRLPPCAHHWHTVIEGIRYGIVPFAGSGSRYRAARLIDCPAITKTGLRFLVTDAMLGITPR